MGRGQKQTWVQDLMSEAMEAKSSKEQTESNGFKEWSHVVRVMKNDFGSRTLEKVRGPKGDKGKPEKTGQHMSRA